MDLSDIVFEDRNKEYGAYLLKKKYVKYLAISFSITILVVLGFTGYSLAYKFYNVKSIPLPRGVVYEPTYLSEEDIAPPEQPELKPLEKVETSEKLNEVPIVTDSLQNAPKKKETPPKEEPKDEEEQDSSAGGGRQGVADGDITVPIQRMPQFPGGENALRAFMRQNIRQNVISKTSRMRGVVVVSFVVQRDGRVGNIKVIKSLSPEIDQECIRVVSAMPLWQPAISGGRPIEIIHNLPFTFAY